MLTGADAASIEPLCHAASQQAILTSSQGDFNLDEMTRTTAVISPHQYKLVLGGAVFSDDFKGQAALAQIDLSDDVVDFAKQFSFATSVTAVTHSPGSFT